MLGRVVNPIVGSLDVDGIVQKIDVNDLLDKVDFNEVLQRIDCWDEIIDSIDIDRALERVDVNKLLQRVDVLELVERAEIPAIVARSTGSVFSPLMDALRAQFVWADQIVQTVGSSCRNVVCMKCNCKTNRQGFFPSAPGLEGEQQQQSSDQTLLDRRRRNEGGQKSLPKGSGKIAIEVQGRFAGTFSRLVAFGVDVFISTTLYIFVLWQLDVIIEAVRNEKFNARDEWGDWGLFMAQILWQFIYFSTAVAASGRTLGKVLVGLKVVNYKDGTTVEAKRAVVRTVFVCLDIVVMIALISERRYISFLAVWGGLELLLGLVRNDRRQMHDIVAGTSVVYSWDARLAQFRQEIEEEQFVFSARNLTGPEQPTLRNRRQTSFWKKVDLQDNTTGDPEEGE